VAVMGVAVMTRPARRAEDGYRRIYMEKPLPG
jgi:hypothetical protein